MNDNQIEKLQYEIHQLKNQVKFFYDKKNSRGLDDREYKMYSTTKEILKRKEKMLEYRINILNNSNSVKSYTYSL